MQPTYTSPQPREQSPSPVPHGALAVVWADLGHGRGCHSPGLVSHLFTSDPAALAGLRESWVRALVDHGAGFKDATEFVAQAASRAQASLQAAEWICQSATFPVCQGSYAQ